MNRSLLSLKNELICLCSMDTPLGKPVEGTGLQQGEYVAPRTEIEKQLVRIWSEILGVAEETLSIKADFFDLGGHSLRAIKLMSILNREFSIKSDLTFIFTNTSIQEMAYIITSLTHQSKSFEHTIRL